ncbi:class I SAM-dependent methyltransferase [Azotobacter salinestris]
MTQANTLEHLYAEHKGYVSDKWAIYLAEYQRLLSPFRDSPVRLVEVGVQNGGSLEIWAKYFPQAQLILGCDINQACTQLTYASDKIQLVVGDINQAATLDAVFNHSYDFDIVIDDGSHTSRDIIQTFCKLFPHLKQGGLYIAEDLHCSYWEKYQGGLYHPRSSMAFFKALADVLNFEHWGLEQHSRERLLQPFGITPELSETLLADLHSVEFVNSMCILSRRPAEQNQLGRRHIVGQRELVCPVKHLDGTYCQTPPQQVGGAMATPPVLSQELEEVASLLQTRLANQDHLLTEQARKIAELEQIRRQMGEQLLRAESQLELLKELMLANGSLESL